MQRLLEKIREILRNKRIKVFFTRTVSLTAAIVVFITTYALVLPAITLEKTASCGIEEHQHNDGCYEEVLICGREESDGHHHDDSCYTVTRELKCGLGEHQHSAEDGCYDEEGNLICQISEHSHDDSCYSEVKTLTCGLQESEGHHHTDACYEKVLVCGKEVHTHSEKCYTEDGEADDQNGNAGNGSSSEVLPQEPAPGSDDAVTESIAATAEAAAEEVLPEGYVPELEPINMEAVLGKKTGFYYFHAEEGQEVPSNSAEITDWQKVRDDTELASTDLVRMYLPYSIPAGSLNETNPTARYRLPGNIHLTDDQIKAINKNENGITAGFAESDPQYQMYLGAEAIEGDRTPDERPGGGAQEYISAVVRAENVYRGDQYIGQDLIFTFVPYTIEKNQKTYDAEQNPLSAGEKVTGWFACDFRLDQIDWIEEGPREETEEETVQNIGNDASEEAEKEADSTSAEENTSRTTVITIEKTADILFASEDNDEGIHTIERTLKMVEQKEETVSEETETPEYQSGTLTADGDGYRITLDYTEEAKIPENASLSVREITAETDKEAYEACLAQAQQHVDESGEAGSTVDSRASRFFDIEILVTNEDGTAQKIEPAAPVSVNIQIAEASADAPESGTGTGAPQNTDPTVLHFAEDGVEAIESTTASASSEGENAEDEDTDPAAKSGEGAGVSFEAESFSIYGLVYTVDFRWEVDGKVYEFSLPGGGFVSLKTLLEVLGVTGDSKQDTAENETDDTKSTDSLMLDDVQISSETNTFAADVEKAEFSNPDLVWIGKTDAETTVGSLKDANALEVQYSKELTQEQIAEINAQTVEAGDWALISMLPFTTEETLTVTMKDGEVFTVKVTDGQLHTYVISANGDTYEIIVTFDDSAEIPEDAKLEVREIKNTEEKYTKNIEATNKKLQSQNAPEVENPVQFEISIVSNGAEIEPKEGSVVKVEIRLVPEVFGMQTENAKENESPVDGVKAAAEDKVIAETEDNVKAGAEDSTEAEKEDNGKAEAETEDSDKAEAEKGEVWFNGEEISAAEEDADAHYTVSHITDDGTAEVIRDVSCSVNEEEKIVLQFETESFSDYLVDTDSSSNNTLSRLPNTIYVGDVIYLYDHSNYTVGGNGYSDVRINNNAKFREIRATSTGTFTITSPAWTEYTMWGQVHHPAESKTITVSAARTGTTPPATIDTVDNASIGLTMHLFDYDLDNSLDSYFNNFNHDDHPVAASFLNENYSINNGHALKFWGSGIGSNYGTANQYDPHLVNSIVQPDLAGGVGGYPRLTANSNPGRSTESLAYLFSPSNGTDKEAYTNVNHLFKKQGDYFVYDSNENYAYYDKSQGNSGSFAVYERTYEQKSRDDGGEQASHTNGKAIGFFPFHKWDEGYDKYVNWNKTLNHHFGLSMSVPFSMPKEPKAIEDTNEQPIIFEFSGDDDLWVFIDGKLAMDIGGIHQPTSGTINFTEKTVTVNGNSQDFDFSGLYDGEKHTLQVFYLERGGCDSNCKIMFNLTQYGDVEFDKVDADDNSVLLPGAVFGLYKDAECTQPLIEKLDAAHGGIRRSFTVETDEHGHAKLEDVPLGDYYLKEIHAPDGYPITIGAQAAHVRVYLDASGNVKVSVNGVESGVKITNKKPSPINLGVKKEWQNEDEQTIPAPDGVTAAFEIKRIRTYEIYTEEKVEGEGRQSSHLTVGWLHNGQPYQYEEFDLVAGSHVTVSWSYEDGYDGVIGCRLNGTDYTKSPVPTNIYSQGFDMPAAGQNAVFYIFDDSETGEAISNINVAGSQFYGNSGGGYIHTFHQITEPDPEFTYTGSDGTGNTVTLPINGSTWQYLFSNLPTFENGTVRTAIEEGGQEKDYDVVFHYSYYLEEVSNAAPEGTTVIYKDFDGNEIQSPTDVETSVSGDETIINRVPFGYLKIQKAVTYNGSSENLTSEQKSKLAGEYKFKIYRKEQCGAGDAVQDPAAPEDAEDKDLVITITIGENGQAVSSDAIKLIAGNYWIKEVESSNPSMFPVENPIPVTVTKNDISTNPVIKSLTNNYDENNGPDKISVDIEKVFTGLDLPSQVPPNFQVKLHYTVNGQPKEVTLHNTELATGENGEKIVWSHSADGFTWHWKVSNIPSEAENFQIKEENYDKAKGYAWVSATLDDEDITNTVTAWHDLSVTAPAADLENVTDDRRTSDSGSNTEFYLEDSDILLSKLTANQGTLVISKHPLNLAERDAVVKGWPSQGGFKTPPRFFSIEEHPNGFSYGDKTVTFGEKNGRTTVKFTQNASAQEAVFAVTYESQEARNNANLENTYEEVPITVDIIKVEKENSSKKLPGAIFTLRQIADAEPMADGTMRTLDGTTPIDSSPTDADGKTSFSNLTHGYYEISEKKAPDGYVLSEDITFYFKVESGEVKWLVKGSDKPSEWEENLQHEMIDFEPAHAAVEADPENGVEAQSAENAAFTISNEPGAALPHTGGPGTGFFTILGSILIAGAGLLLRRRQRTL